MKAIINGKRYDTETATELGSYSNGLGGDDFRYVYETLYRSKSGNYFMVGSGGAMTQYAKSNGSSTWGSTIIVPFTPEEAFKWAQRHLTAEEVEAAFADRIEDA